MAQAQHIDIDAALKAEQERLTTRKTELESELSEITSRLGRISRYFNDEPPPVFKLTPPKPPGDRVARGEVQTKVREAIYTAGPDGISTGELNQILKGTSPQSIQNSLKALRDQNAIIKDDRRGGKYRPVTIEPTPPPEA
jgi:DNA-binding transcriptional ArsR family regulator